MGDSFPAGTRKGGSHQGKAITSRTAELARLRNELRADRRYARKHPKTEMTP